MRGRVGDMVMAEDALSVARSAVTTSFSSSSSSSSSSPPEIYGPYSTFPVALAPIMKRCFSIRNGSIFDRDGWLAQALAHAPAVVAPLSTVDLCIPSTDIIPQLFPAAFTSSLVSLSRYPSLVSDEKASLSAVSTILLRDPSISKNIAPCRVNITREWVCLEHSELAIVRHIDIQSQTVILTLPCLGNNNDCSAVTSVKEPNIRPDRLAVIRAAFPLPIQLAYSPTFLTHAYITGDLVGEGSNVMKARKNMKRK